MTILKLENYTINIKEVITWKDILKNEKLIFGENIEVWDLLLFYIDDILKNIEKDEKIIKNKKEIENIIFNPKQTTRKDLNLILDFFREELNEKKK